VNRRERCREGFTGGFTGVHDSAWGLITRPFMGVHGQHFEPSTPYVVGGRGECVNAEPRSLSGGVEGG
jgi:hypothetical protein